MTAPPPPPTLEDHAPLTFSRHTGTRERARRHHPDIGGDSAQFIRCKRARDALLMVCDP